MKFGASWVHEHHFDNKGKLAAHIVKTRKKHKK